jgi:hypothetical protein
MNRPRPHPITTDQIYKSQARVNLVCGFYGPAHPECKKVVDEDVKLYMGFMKQFTDKTFVLDKGETLDKEQCTTTGTRDNCEPLDKTDVLDLLQQMMRDNL